MPCTLSCVHKIFEALKNQPGIKQNARRFIHNKPAGVKKLIERYNSWFATLQKFGFYFNNMSSMACANWGLGMAPADI